MPIQPRQEFVVPIQPRAPDFRRRPMSQLSSSSAPSSSEGGIGVMSYLSLSCPDAVCGVLPRGALSAGRGPGHAAGSSSASSAAEVPWDNLSFGAQIQPYKRYAHRLLDVSLLSCFLEIGRVEEISGESVKLLLRTLKFLRACDYHNDDICCILAHASAYFIDAFALCGQSMSSLEVGNVLAILTFVAHAWVQDETCPLRTWHQHLFRPYCQLHVLNSAVVRLLEIRNYMLRLEREEVRWRFAQLEEASNAFPPRRPAGRGGLADLRDQLARCVDRASQ